MYEKDDIGLVDATMSGLKMLDLFSGIGGFHEGFKRAGYQFDWVGFSEIDKYASAVYGYNYKESEELGDIKLIRPRRDLPDNIDILCGGFPCQAFSMAGKRLGFDDTRGTLFFEIARLLTHYVENKRPVRCLVLENVKGLLSHDDGRTFAVIYRILSDLGYTIEFQLLNTRWWKPQNRERIYIVGYVGNRGGPQVFPIGESIKHAATTQGVSQRKEKRLRSHDTQTARSISARYYKDGAENLLQIPEATKKGYAEAEVGDSINLSVPNSETRRGRVGKGEAQTLDTGMQQYTIQSGVRRLTPRECNRLQGFSDEHNKYGVMDGKVVEMSDTQRYKQAGNAVTVDVVQAVATIIKERKILL
jgi:DNA (cytosine-5)-methyltransferase 1